uniref:Complex1_LYR_dom domain-containing protein n=1 Tax=Mesocestoides corti TaxID=53468 RepID=A0A5K3FEA1_MESCO
MSGSRRVLSLYREMLRASKNFSDYNFRTYFVRRVKEEFRKHEHITSGEDLENFLAEGQKTLGILQRQSELSRSFKGLKLTIE